ncbi:hypothetical protein [Candidatus Nitrosarchaeum limnium]|uniref:hypothetical protein n=1 Tax=Candidatus Nitrosarchaeum limnium TaxID=1007084 RepID=UPI0009DA0100|nr:hypothetical protein [Candidatus Nitrosarchaeum limnium]
MNTCKGICVRFKAKSCKNINRYENGQKCCTICGIFIFHENTRCPCCGCKLRITPRASKSRKKLQKERNMIRV